MFRHNPSKRGEGYCEMVDESWKDISGFVEIRVVPPTEKRSGQVLAFVKGFIDRMI